ncbi:MAG: DNA cytosine methyltransferase [Rhodopila sp.]|jgi:hypothetical protein
MAGDDGAPCAGFSTIGRRDPFDERNELYRQYVRIVADMRPSIFVMENLPNILLLSRGKFRDDILLGFRHSGYANAFHFRISAVDFGVSRRRERIFFGGTRDDLALQPDLRPFADAFLEALKVASATAVREAIGDLPADVVPSGRSLPYPVAQDMRLSLWETTGFVDHDLFLSGFPVRLNLETLPRQEAAFLPGLDVLDVEPSLARRLAEIGPDLSTPLVSETGHVADIAKQSREKTLSPDCDYRIMTGQAPERPVPGLRQFGQLCGLWCLEADTGNPDAREWLERRGLRVSSGLSVQVSGGFPLGEGARGPTFAAGFPILFTVRRSQGKRWPVMVRRRGGGIEAVLDADHPVAVMDPLPGEHVLLFDSQGASEEIVLTVVPSEASVDVVTIDTEPTEPSMDDLLAGNIVLRIASSLPIEGLKVSLSTSVTGIRIFETVQILPGVPSALGPRSALFSGLDDRTRWDDVPSSLSDLTRRGCKR